jgi:hypothetical protein
VTSLVPLSLAVFAQNPDVTAPRSGAEPGAPASPDLGEIQEALDADASARAGPPPPAAAPTAAPGGAGTFSLNPDLSLVTDVAAAWFWGGEPLQTGAHDPVENGFNLQQIEMTLGKAVDPYFRFDASIVFGHEGVEVEEAYATTMTLPFNLQVRAGQFLTRFGRLNTMHPHAWDFVDQPFALGRLFGGEGNRGVGVEVSYLAPLPWYVELVASATDPRGDETARSFLGGEDLGLGSPADVQGTTAIKQFFPLSDDLSLLWGLSGAFGPNATGFGNRTDIFGTDLYVKYRPAGSARFTTVALQAEWYYRRRQVPEDVLQDTGGYASLAWRFAQRWAIAGRYEQGSAPWNLGGETAADELDPDWTRARHRVSANVTFRPTEFSRLRLQASRDGAGWREGPVWAVFLTGEFVVGAHGAHKF